MHIETWTLSEFTVRTVQRMLPVINLAPPYQREGRVWNRESQQLLIDSILNRLDVPKFYFEQPEIRHENSAGEAYQFVVIDGKQRIEAIAGFLNDGFPLSDDFRFFEAEHLNDVLRGKFFSELWDIELATRLLDYELVVVAVRTDTADMIEEMFQRLNAASALNAAEKRNAVSGPTRTSANKLAEHEFLQRCSPIRNARYKYREFGAKFLAIEDQIKNHGKIVDTKSDRLMSLFKAPKGVNPRISEEDILSYQDAAETTLDRMSSLFIDSDPLLGSIGTVVVYYIAFRNAEFTAEVTRDALAEFEDERRNAARMSEADSAYSHPEYVRLREYNALVQSTNDGSALLRRAAILRAFVHGSESGTLLSSLAALEDDEAQEDEGNGVAVADDGSNAENE